jgi:hypothetical protein
MEMKMSEKVELVTVILTEEDGTETIHEFHPDLTEYEVIMNEERYYIRDSVKYFEPACYRRVKVAIITNI